jgi:hypothetical protein
MNPTHIQVMRSVCLGNKLPQDEENPVDRVFLRITASLAPYFRATHHTPNMLTTYSFVCGLLGLAALAHGHVGWFTSLLLLSYLFDCADGQFARRYGMVTTFGDLYDHGTDLLVLVLMLIVLSRHTHTHTHKQQLTRSNATQW